MENSYTTSHLQSLSYVLCKHPSFKAAIGTVEPNSGCSPVKPKKTERVDSKIVNNKASLGLYYYNGYDKDYFNLDKRLAGKTQGEKKEKKTTKSGSQFLIIETVVLG